MANFQCKKLDPLVTGDIGDYCVECLQSTAFGTGRFVNRISADRDVIDEKGNYLGRRDGWLCPECNWFECDRCDEKFMMAMTAHLTMFTKTMSQGHSLMVHIESTTNV